jgi:hypothetical protein
MYSYLQWLSRLLNSGATMMSKQIAVLVRPQKAVLDHVNNKVATLPGLKVQMKVTMYDHDDEINHENVKALMHPRLKK